MKLKSLGSFLSNMASPISLQSTVCISLGLFPVVESLGIGHIGVEPQVEFSIWVAFEVEDGGRHGWR